MDNLKFTLNISCHQNLAISGVCRNTDCKGALGCVQCLFSDHYHETKSVLSIPDLIREADTQYEIIRNIRSDKDPPLELINVLTTQDESLTNLTSHIEKEISNMNQEIDEYQKAFIVATDKIRETLTKELQKEIEHLRESFREFKTEVDSFYRGDQVKCPRYPSLAEIMGKVNKITEKRELEGLMGQLLKDIKYGEDNSLYTLEQKIVQKEREIEIYLHTLKAQIGAKPSFIETLQKLKTKSLQTIDALSNYFESLYPTLISESVFNTYESHMDSRILDTPEEEKMLIKWLPYSEIEELSLLYRGSRDGYTAQSFHRRVDEAQLTITLIKSNFDKIFGGYSDQKWSGVNEYKHSNNCFIFSISDKQKYKMTNKHNETAVGCWNGYGPIFGNDSSIYIRDGSDKNYSFSKLDDIYEIKDRSPESLAGGTKFTIKEIEVWQVEFKKV